VTISKSEQASTYRSIQVLLLVFSVIFFVVIAYGYYHLFISGGVFLALLGGSVMATFAWYLARVIGSSPGGPGKSLILFAPLLVVSAAGVYNSLMLYLEGGRVIADAATDSESQYARLQLAAEKGLSISGAAAKTARIQTLAESLFSEIRNPLNCGQGPEARRLMSTLQAQLPGFTPLSNPAKDCARNDDVISDYRSRINSLVERANWNNPDLLAVVGGSTLGRRALEEVRSEAATDYSPNLLKKSLTVFEAQDNDYRELKFRLARNIDDKSIADRLPINEVQSLGNAFKLPALFFSRLDELSTWVYLAIAIGFDLLLVYLFQLVTASRTRRPRSTGSLAGAW
jgi:hypothetical protein